jgi:hypothetical protein
MQSAFLVRISCGSTVQTGCVRGVLVIKRFPNGNRQSADYIRPTVTDKRETIFDVIEMRLLK